MIEFKGENEIESSSSALISLNSTQLLDGLRREFILRSGTTFNKLTRLFQAREAVLLYALNFPSDFNTIEEAEDSISLKNVELASEAYLDEAKRQWAIIEGGSLSHTMTDEYTWLRRIRACLQLYHITFGMTVPIFFTEAYLTWLNSSYIAPGQQDGNLILRSADPFQERTFGAYFIKCAMRGLNSSVVALLQLFPASPLVTAVRNLVQTMPRYTAASKATFPQAWSAWKTSCQEVANEHLGNALLNKEMVLVHDLLKIMSGQCEAGESVLHLLSFYCDTWQELLGAMLLFHFPTMAPHRVESLVECIQAANFYTTRLCDVHSDRFQISLLTNDLVKAMKHAHAVDPWLSVHLLDLAEKRALVEDFQPYASNSDLTVFKERCIVEYVTQSVFINDPHLFLVGAHYLAECPNLGKELLCRLLPSVPLKDIPSRDRALALCQDLSLPEPFNSLCRSAVEAHMEAQEFSLAVKYLSRMSTVPASLSHQLAMSIISAFLAGEHFDLEDLCAAIRTSSISTLKFVCQYFEFHASYKAERFREAARMLEDLILCLDTPSFMLVILFLDAIPLLEGPRLYFRSSTISEMLKVHARLDYEIFPISPYKACLAAYERIQLLCFERRYLLQDKDATSSTIERVLRLQISKALQLAYYNASKPIP